MSDPVFGKESARSLRGTPLRRIQPAFKWVVVAVSMFLPTCPWKILAQVWLGGVGGWMCASVHVDDPLLSHPGEKHVVGDKLLGGRVDFLPRCGFASSHAVDNRHGWDDTDFQVASVGPRPSLSALKRAASLIGRPR